VLRVIEHSAKSLKVVRNDTLEWDTFRPNSIVIMSLSRTVSEIFSVK